MGYFYLDAKEFDKVLDAMEKFTDKTVAERVINEYLHEEAGDKIKRQIQEILPVSGRKWVGKKAAASSTDPLRTTNGNLTVEVRSKGAYHYLYFPDDGSNTVHHQGNQQFMFKGAEKASDEVVNGIIDKLVRQWEES